MKNLPPGPRRSPEVRAIQDAIIQWSEDHDGQTPNENNLAALIKACRKACPKFTMENFLLACQTLNERRHEN